MEFFMPDRKPDYECNKPDPYPLLSESMRKVVDYQAAHAADAFDTNCSWDELRVKYVQERRFWNEGGPEAFKTVEVMVPGPMGDVPARIYYPDDKPEHYAVVFIHGGGYTVGSNDTHDRMMRSVMASSGCCVIGVDYHLAPEAKFPIPLYEAAAVDGAGKLRCAIHITLPGLLPTFIVIALLAVANFMNSGLDQYFMFQNAVVMKKIEVLDLYTYRVGLQNQDYSYATAVGMLKSLISLAMLFTTNAIAKHVRGDAIV